MASTDANVTMRTRPEAPAPLFRRAKPADAIDLALQTFVSGIRVDMQTLAAQLDVSPATLYRWFGTRAQLLDKVGERLAVQFGTIALAQAMGGRDERVCDYIRQLMISTVSFEPARSFVAREPQLALKLLLGKDGSIHRVLADQLGELIADIRSPSEAQRLDGQIQLIVQVTTALQWATLAIGEEPQIESAVNLVRTILASSPTSR